MLTRRMIVPMLIALFAMTTMGTAHAEDKVQAYLFGFNEVPPVLTLANGLANFELKNDDTIEFALCAFHVQDVLFAHIHQGAAGTNGPVLVTLCGPKRARV